MHSETGILHKKSMFKSFRKDIVSKKAIIYILEHSFKYSAVNVTINTKKGLRYAFWSKRINTKP